MTKQTDFNFANMSKEQSMQITKMVKETLATEFVSARSFTIVDLWNIRRKSKTTINSRRKAAFI